tara:strand:- start:697 stop:1092 length:396 start_codon:yes stop_codon:yes gene_type:complete
MTQKKKRKEFPLYRGLIKYFPDALLEVSKCSVQGQKQHAPDMPLAWDREKSSDDLDALSRHLLDAGKMDDDGILHSTKIAWRSLANLQKELEEIKIEDKRLAEQYNRNRLPEDHIISGTEIAYIIDEKKKV